MRQSANGLPNIQSLVGCQRSLRWDLDLPQHFSQFPDHQQNYASMHRNERLVDCAWLSHSVSDAR